MSSRTPQRIPLRMTLVGLFLAAAFWTDSQAGSQFLAAAARESQPALADLVVGPLEVQPLMANDEASLVALAINASRERRSSLLQAKRVQGKQVKESPLSGAPPAASVSSNSTTNSAENREGRSSSNGAGSEQGQMDQLYLELAEIEALPTLSAAHVERLLGVVRRAGEAKEVPLRAAASLLAIDGLANLKRISEAEKVIQENFSDAKMLFPERTARAVLRVQVLGGKLSEAIETFQQNRRTIESPSPDRGVPELERMLVELAVKAMSSQDQALSERASGLVMELAREYPLTETAVFAFGLLKERYKSAADLENALWPTDGARRSVATSVFRRLGNVSAYREFALRLGRLRPELSQTELQALARVPEDRSRLLADAEWFMDVREYETAHRILQVLHASRPERNSTPSRLPEAEKIHFLLARCSNSMSRPMVAAELYRSLFTESPKSSFAKQAQRNFVLSLHYAKKHAEVVEQIDLLSKGDPGFGKRMKWLRFWSLYLASKRTPLTPVDYGKLAAAEAQLVISKSRDPREVERYRYWLARLDERAQRLDRAREGYDQILAGGDASVYRVFARWRRDPLTFPALPPMPPMLMAGFEVASAGEELSSRLESPSTSAASASGSGMALRALPLRKGAGPRVPEELLITTSVAEARPLKETCPRMPPGVPAFASVGLGEFARALLRTWNPSAAKGESGFACAAVAHAAEDFFLASVLGRRAIAKEWAQSKGDFGTRLKDRHEGKRLEFPLAFAEPVSAVAARLGLDTSLIYGVMKAESHFKPLATSEVGARGLMQIMPQTGNRIASLIRYSTFHPDALYHPEVNIALGAWYLNRLKTYYKGDLVRLIAAYNAGPTAVDRWAEQSRDLEIDEFAENIPFVQTFGYVRKVFGYMDAYLHLGSGDDLVGLKIAFGPGLDAPQKDLEVF